MRPKECLDKLFAPQGCRAYQASWKMDNRMRLLSPGGYELAAVNQTLSDNDTMAGEHYFSVGESAAVCINTALTIAGNPEVGRILDLPCGHGRVLRHLQARFPEAAIDACDLDRSGVEFCVATFGVRGIVSAPDLTKADLTGPYDLIWVGSLLTHVSRPTFQAWTKFLATLLSPTGLVVASMHGRYSEVINETHPYLARSIWDGRIMPGYRAEGYGYADYVEGDTGLHGVIEGDYGISIARPDVVVKDVSDIPNTRIFWFGERAWIGHHDIIAYGRPGFDQ